MRKELESHVREEKTRNKYKNVEVKVYMNLIPNW